MYKNLKILDHNEHSFYRYTPPQEFFFAKELNLIPIVYSELSALCCDYPIVIMKQDNQIELMIVTGIDKNNTIGSDGKWSKGYIPAFLRRYPFTLVKSSQEDDTLHVGFDFDSGCFSSPNGSPLFTNDGSPSETLMNIKSLLKAYQEESQNTQAVLTLLQEQDLLVESQITLKNSKGEDQLVDGFFSIDKEKLLKQDDEFLLQAIRGGWMEMIELHLLSLKSHI